MLYLKYSFFHNDVFLKFLFVYFVFHFLSAFQVTKIIDKTVGCSIPIQSFANIIPVMIEWFCSNALDLFHNSGVDHLVIVSQKPKEINFLTVKVFNIFQWPKIWYRNTES